jgi:hypothetical protein
LTREDIRRLCGDLPDWKIAKIIASRATFQELETAVIWAQGADPGPDHHALHGQAACLYEILMAGEEWEEEQGR